MNKAFLLAAIVARKEYVSSRSSTTYHHTKLSLMSTTGSGQRLPDPLMVASCHNLEARPCLEGPFLRSSRSMIPRFVGDSAACESFAGGSWLVTRYSFPPWKDYPGRIAFRDHLGDPVWYQAR